MYRPSPVIKGSSMDGHDTYVDESINNFSWGNSDSAFNCVNPFKKEKSKMALKVEATANL